MWAARLVVLLSVLIGCNAGPADTDPAEPERCERVRDHLIEIRLGSSVDIDRDAHREAMKAALGDFVAKCTAQMTVKQANCALDARDSSVIAACNKQSI